MRVWDDWTQRYFVNPLSEENDFYRKLWWAALPVCSCKKESEVQEEEQQVLQITAWEGPYGFDATSEEKKQQMETEFSEEGIQNGIDWLNALWEADPEKWKRAKSEW